MRTPGTGEPYGTAYWNEHGERVTENLEGDDSRVIVDRVVPFLRAAVAAERPRWELPTDEGGMEKLGQTMMTILQLSDILTSYFTISGISLLLMVARSLKMVDFQRHLDLTVRTLSRSSLDLLHFLIIFFISPNCLMSWLTS